MPQSAWSAKRERQYEHIKESEKKQGRSTKRAKEIAARTVNKERAQKGALRHTPGEGPHERAALQRGPAPERPGAVPDDQGAAAAGGRRKEVATS